MGESAQPVQRPGELTFVLPHRLGGLDIETERKCFTNAKTERNKIYLDIETKTRRKCSTGTKRDKEK